MNIDRDTPPVISHSTTTIRQQLDQHHRPIAGNSFVDTVVSDLFDQVVRPVIAGRTDVHAGSLANRLQAFQDLDLTGIIVICI